MPITKFSELDLSKQYTYADYLQWQFEERVELIKGWIYKMPASPSGRSPAPRRMHQKITAKTITILSNFFENTRCDVYPAPFDVRLIKNTSQKGKDIENIVQPDISVICDRSKLDDRGCIGAPDLIVEILSRSTAKIDYNEKFNLYEANGVKEYWIINPDSKTVETYILVKQKYERNLFFEDAAGTIKTPLFPELEIDCKEMFKD